ncbi:uncharacterized protein LOC134231288 [Saccostrea cucullata]|uniref:uncharacterized protein LOC134231288 n=1 Tax=Saccostrea cuccullata TaxID=36930 RepID=UPI002ED17739
MTQESVTNNNEKNTEVNEEKITDFGSTLGIAFGVLIPTILMVVVVFLLIKYGKLLSYCRKDECKGNKADKEAHPGEVQELFKNKEEEKKNDVENERNESKGNIQPVDIKSYLTEEDIFLECNEEVEKQDIENKWKEEISSGEEDTGGVFDDTLDSIKKKGDEEKGGSQDLHEFLVEVSTRLAKKMLYRVLKVHVTDPQGYLTDESKVSKVKELLPAEYQASVSFDSIDKKSIPVMYAILQLSPENELQPKSGWGQGVKDRDTGVGDDVERLYRVHTLIREIANPEQVSIDGYTRLFKVLFEAVDRLDVRGHCKEDYQKFIQKWENLQRNQWFRDNLKALQSLIKNWSLIRSSAYD